MYLPQVWVCVCVCVNHLAPWKGSSFTIVRNRKLNIYRSFATSSLHNETDVVLLSDTQKATATTQFKLCFKTSLRRGFPPFPLSLFLYHPLTPQYNAQLLRRGRWPNFEHMFLSSACLYSVSITLPTITQFRMTPEKYLHSNCILHSFSISHSFQSECASPSTRYFTHSFIFLFELYLQSQLTPVFAFAKCRTDMEGGKGEWVCVRVCVSVLHVADLLYLLLMLLPSPLTLSNWIHFALVFI